MAAHSKQIIERVSKKLGNVSDYQVAQALGVERQFISAWKRDRHMSDDAALKAAEILGENEDALLLEIAADRATSDTGQKRLLALARRLHRGAAVVTAITGLGFLHSTSAHANNNGISALEHFPSIDYANLWKPLKATATP